MTIASSFAIALLLAGLAANSQAADVQIGLAYSAPDALVVSYSLPAQCARLAFQKTGKSAAAMRAQWQPLDDCGSVDGEALVRGKAACASLRFKVPASTERWAGYSPAFPIGAGIYAHTSNYAVAADCGASRLDVSAPGSIIAQGRIADGQLSVDGAQGESLALMLLPIRLPPADGPVMYFDPALGPDTIAQIREVAAATVDYYRAQLPDAPYRAPALVAGRAAGRGGVRVDGDADDVLRLALFNWPLHPDRDTQREATLLVSHEFSHRFQLRDAIDVYRDARLIHEGGAEFLRWLLALRMGWVSETEAAQDLDAAYANCALDVGAHNWTELSADYIAGHKLAYTCGLAVYAYGYATRQDGQSALAHFNAFYRDLGQGKQPDFARSIECGDAAACQPRWLPALLGKQQPMAQSWTAMFEQTGLAKAVPPNPAQTQVMTIKAFKQLMFDDCGAVSIYMQPDSLIVDSELKTCKTLRAGMVVTSAEGQPLPAGAQTLAAMTAACRSQGALSLGLKDGGSLRVACAHPYEPPAHFYAAQMATLLSRLNR